MFSNMYIFYLLKHTINISYAKKKVKLFFLFAVSHEFLNLGWASCLQIPVIISQIINLAYTGTVKEKGILIYYFKII